MVLSNKKLKQQLRAKLADISHSKTPDSKNPETPNSLKQLLDSATQKPILSKREKRRENTSSLQSNGENKVTHVEESLRGKKRGREKKGVENGVELEVEGDQNGGEPKKRKKMRWKKKETDNDEEKSGVAVELGVEGSSGLNKEAKVPVKNKKKKAKKKHKKKSKSKNETQEKQSEVENAVLSDQIVADTSQENEDDSKKVYVGGMPYSSTEDDMWSYFEHCGAITDIDCMKFPETGKFRGIAIISFKTEEAAKKALALDGSDMDGLYLKIQPYKATRAVKSSHFCPPVIEGYNRIYTGNLSWDITEGDLQNFFSDCNILSIRFGEDKETQEFKGYAHVDFADSESLTKALKLDQEIVCGRPVKISRAVPAKGPLRNLGSVPAKLPLNNLGSASMPPVVTPQENNSGVSSGKLKRRTCYECGERGHLSSDCPKKQATDQTKPNDAEIPPSDLGSASSALKAPPVVTPSENNSGVGAGKIKRRTCYECGERGHLSSDCPNKQATDQTNPSDAKVPLSNLGSASSASSALKAPPVITPLENNSGVSAGKIKRRTCYECGERGHLSSDCPHKQATDQTNRNDAKVPLSNLGSASKQPAVIAVTPQENNSGVSAGKLKRRTCYECGERGHISSDCPKKQATD